MKGKTMSNAANPKRKRYQSEAETPKKKRKLVDGKGAHAASSGEKVMPVQDPSKEFAEDLVILNSDEKLPNTRIKEAILDKVTPLMLVLSGLNTDRASTIHFVLSTLKQAILENNKIAKKDKLRLFNSRNLSPLLQLYKWRGHQLTWKSRTNRYKKKKKPGVAADEEEEEGANPADPEELLQVRENVHQFLSILCTSHKAGIVFKDASLGTSGSNCNPVLLEVLKNLSRPWRDELTAAACYYPPPVQELIRDGIGHEDAAVRADCLRLLLTVTDQVAALQTQLANSVEYGAMARAALCSDITRYLPAPNQLTTLWSQLTASEAPPAAEVALLARVLIGCQRVASQEWRLQPMLLGQLQGKLAELQLPEDELQLLRDQLQQLTEGRQYVVPVDRSLVPSDVPRILAEIRGEHFVETTEDTTEAAENPEGVKLEPKDTTEKYEQKMKDDALPTLSGASKQQRLASFVAMTTKLLRTTPPPLAKLRALVAQLIEALNDVTTTSTKNKKRASSESMDDASTAPTKRSKKSKSKTSAVKEEPEDNTDDVTGTELSRPSGWVDWVKLVLKKSLRQSEVGETVLESLTLLCEKGLFPSSGGAPSQTEPLDNSVSCELLYELLLSHSAFLERVLDPAESELVLRDSILRLMLAVANRSQHVCRASHVALLLAAYGATMSETDQTILLLISRYELAGVSLQAYQPMVWGSAALNFYNPTQGGGHSLKSQPSADDVIGLLDSDKMAATCRRLPLKITLKPVRVAPDPGVYDIRFLAPLLLRLTAPEQQGEPLKLVSAGALGVALCLLSCRQVALRSAGWTTLARLYQQLQASRHQRQRRVWLTLLDLVRAAAAGAPQQRLPFVVVHGWCRLVLVLQQPTHRLFKPATRLLLRHAKNGSLEIGKVPLFFELFNSASSLEHRSEHAWMVGHLCQSVRQMSDYGVLQRTVTYKLVMGLAASCLASARPQLLKVLEVTCRIPGALLDLHYRHGLLVWVSALLRRFGREPATRAAVVSMAAQMAQTLRAHYESGAPRPVALLAALEALVARLSDATSEDAALCKDVERVRQEVAQMQAVAAT
ncbi:Nucleolar pre-ribosomal-associated protein 1 [Amphibalanus amphitrite]|uniref:Nucleolar pre-ribosomal-associated protein 1 n=1 Tax=Amphibalanus amphitrite TaxID=1232801 RepID=A0A6A4WN41_AMPAM|nr:Nucleolar pre-ribosomal-associated protein 1 [Amphibalanus amphitrite]